jgi:hypothetical protein
MALTFTEAEEVRNTILVNRSEQRHERVLTSSKVRPRMPVYKWCRATNFNSLDYVIYLLEQL